MNNLTIKRDHEWLLSQGFTNAFQPICYQLPYGVYVNTGCYAYGKAVVIRGTTDTLCVMRQVPNVNSTWTAKLISTTPTSNGFSANVGFGRTSKEAIQDLARKEDVPIQTFIDTDKPLEEVPNLSPEEKRKASREYLMSLTPYALMDLLDQKMRSSIHMAPIPGTVFADGVVTYGASDLVEKTFKKSADAMGRLGGEAWLLAHGFRCEESHHFPTRTYYRWSWDGYIEGEKRHINVFYAVPDDGESWSAVLVEDGNVTDKRCCGNSPMAALDALLCKYVLTSEGEQS